MGHKYTEECYLFKTLSNNTSHYVGSDHLNRCHFANNLHEVVHFWLHDNYQPEVVEEGSIRLPVKFLLGGGS